VQEGQVVRTAVAAALISVLLALAWAPHVHTGPHGDHDCAACVARGAEPARSAEPDLAPVRTFVVEPAAAVGTAEPPGAPLGAIPGQSPPVNG
jgi:hypothetical protein